MTTAEEQGRLWSAHAADWAAQEEMEPERFEPAAALVRPGDAVLEVGCGSGVFLRMAAERGARVHGIDAAPALVELGAPAGAGRRRARRRRRGAAVRGRQLRPRGRLQRVLLRRRTWSPRCARPAGWRGPARRWSPASGAAPRRATCCAWSARCARSAAPRRTARGPSLADAGRARGARRAGRPRAGPRVRPHARAALPGPGHVRPAGARRPGRWSARPRPTAPPRSPDAVRAAAAPFRRADGSVRLENEWRYLVSRASSRSAFTTAPESTMSASA